MHDFEGIILHVNVIIPLRFFVPMKIMPYETFWNKKQKKINGGVLSYGVSNVPDVKYGFINFNQLSTHLWSF